MNLVIIPARAASRRISHKNIALLGGKPLIAYTIEAALAADGPLQIVVSTDCDAVIRIATEYGVAHNRQPASLSRNDVPLEAVVRHVLSSRQGSDIARIAILQPTSPLRGPKRIDEAMRLLARGTAESAVSVCELQHAQWASHIVDGIHCPHYRYDIRPSTDSVLPMYSENGAVYAFTPHVLDTYCCRLGGVVYPIVMDRIESVNIDTPADLAIAERLLPLVYRGGQWL